MTCVVPNPGNAAAREWQANWPIVLTAVLGNTLLSMAVLSMGAFMAPLEQSFGWSRVVSSLGVFIYAAVGTLASPLIGVILDNWGARRMVLSGTVLTGLVFSLFAINDGSIALWVGLWLSVSFANQLIITMVWSAAVSDVFTASRGLALGVTFTGNGISAFLAPLLANALIESYGWREAYVIMGTGWAGLVAIVAWFLFVDRHERRRRDMALAAQPALTGLSVREGLRSPIFAKLVTAAFLAFLMTMGLVPHLIPILTTGGIVRDTAVRVASLLGLAMVVGKLTIGALADRVHAKLLVAFCCGLPALPCAMLLSPDGSILMPVIAVVLLGLAVGSQLTMTVYLATRYFGMRCFGRLFSFIGSAVAFASAVGPLAAGAIFDARHSYAPFLAAGIPISLISGALLLSLGRYPQFDEPAAAPGEAAVGGGQPATAVS